jgi:hypothetical protein
VPAKIVVLSVGEGRHRQTRRVGCNERSRAASRCDSVQQLPLDHGILDDGFNDPIGFVQLPHIVFEAACLNLTDIPRHKEGAWADTFEIAKSTLSELSSDVKKHYRQAGVCNMGGYLRAHRTRAKNGDSTNHR